ncbi:glycosyltransferase family 2 protein [Chroogloeocystis siderophila]|jgi:glycosyltransferase involved in cell wall biosynthesis|uniref:Family 2 glycosyl transferase n=1 Tax=Chroogloeocystis siderophila 5.2 s.c.1 TaxID=247279 RepID=A0A1U7HBP6_9CHRO|nr:glycosyltransferase family 2 protein [Chroogloeocystis siderophila]OKH21017.1 family 2 glycosyl transferase [Chroogloeocystis siderophila 5.2 s.c.1]
MSNTPRLSIGLPVYNGDRLLAKALDSILAQTYSDFELIISDNASTDRTQAICEGYAAKDSRIKYTRNERNIGGHNNFNRVFELATGEYFKWAAHDDICAPDFLEKCIQVLEANPSVVLCYPRTKLIDENEKFLPNNCDENPLLTHSPKSYVRFRNLIIDSFAKPHRCLQLFGVMRRDILAKTPLLGNYPGADKVLLVKMALLGQYYEIPEYLFFNRHHAQRASKALANPYLRATWLDPTLKEGKLVFPQGRVLLGYINSINTTPIGLDQKIYCYLHLGIWLFKYKNALIKELIKAAIWPIYFSIQRRKIVTSN